MHLLADHHFPRAAHRAAANAALETVDTCDPVHHATGLPESDAFDCMVLTQLLRHVFDLKTGVAVEGMGAEWLDPHDPSCTVCITVRAVKPAQGEVRRAQSCGTENVPVTRLPLAAGPAAPLALPSTLEMPLLRSITNRPPLSVSLPRRNATWPTMVMILRLKS